MGRIIVTGVTQAARAMRLKRFLESQKDSFDEWHLWINTSDPAQVPVVTEPWIKIVNPGDGDGGSLSRFMPGYCGSGTAYARLDENIAWMDPAFVKTLFEYREGSSHFLVHANVVNSSPLAHVHERLGCITSRAAASFERPSFIIDDQVAKTDKYIAVVVASFKDSVAQGDTEAWTFGRWMLYHELVDLYAFAWLGSHFDVFGGRVAMEETPFLCRDYPRRYGMLSSVCGKALCIRCEEDIVSPPVAAEEPVVAPVVAPVAAEEPVVAPVVAAEEPVVAPVVAAEESTTPPPPDAAASAPPAPRKRRATRRVVVS